MGGRDVLVHCAGMTGDAIETHKLSDLLPHAFGPTDLGIGRAPRCAITAPPSLRQRGPIPYTGHCATVGSRVTAFPGLTNRSQRPDPRPSCQPSHGPRIRP